jgi:anti-sigma B factor antagonist
VEVRSILRWPPRVTGANTVEQTTLPAADEPAVLTPSGRLDASAAPRLRQDITNLLEQGTSRIVVNLADVSYLSSSILRVLLTAHKLTRHAGGALALCCLHPYVLRAFRLVGFDQVLAIYDTEEEARQAVAAPPRARASSKEKQ